MQMLMEKGRTYEASKIKKYTDIIFKLHRKYVEELKENSELRPQISTAENKLKMALELTENSEEAMQHLKQTLGGCYDLKCKIEIKSLFASIR